MADPSGNTVTFLATDIEGSTARWEDAPDAMQRAVSQHDALVRAAISEQNGTVFKATGDGFYAVFVEPLAAIRASLAIQHAVQSIQWDQIGQLRVRVALHLGPAELRDGDYFGQTLNRAARLVNATEGSEILLSDSVAEAVRTELPPGVALVGLGDLRLRSLREPMRVYRLTGGLDLSASPSSSPTAMPAPDGRLRVFVLGGFRIEGPLGALANDGWTRRKARQLFKCLLTRPSRRLTRDEAYELFWPDSDVAPSNLRVVLHALRQALAGVGMARPDELIVLDSDGVALTRNKVWIDADAFEQLAAPQHDAAGSDDDLEAAARLYAGEFLADDLYETWTAAPRDHLRRLWCDVLLELSHRRERRGEIDLAAAALQSRLAADACDELATVEMMGLWVRHGRRSDALRAYQRLAEALRRELSVEPGTEATRLRDRIVSGEIGQAPVAPPLAAPASQTGSAASEAGSASAVARPVSPASRVARLEALHARALPSFEPSYPFPMPAVLAGRHHELEALGRIVERGRFGGQTVLIGGPAGIGKSTLAGAVVREARERGFVCLVGGSFEQDTPIPFGPIRDALSDYLLAREPHELWSELGTVVGDLEPIIPELRYHLNLPGPDTSRQLDGGQLLSVVHGCLRALATRQPVLLCLEDLHAADDDTINALPYIGRQIRRLPVTVLGTYRTDEMTPDHRLARLLPKLIRERMVEEIRLRPLAREETAQLAAGLLDGPPDSALVDWLHGLTEGTPLFAEHLLLALRDEDRLVREPGGWRLASPDCPMPPPIVRAVLERRLGQLELRTRQTLEMAAVLSQPTGQPTRQARQALGQPSGQTVGLTLLAAALGVDRAVAVSHLEVLLDARLLREAGSGYRFEQPLLREAIYQGLSVHRRATLEVLAARARETLEARGLNGASHGAHGSHGVNGQHRIVPAGGAL